jgi:adenylate cyclase
MVQKGFKRKLTAIFSADAVGYSRLMAEDEAATVKTIATYREVMTALIKQHRGRVVDSPGDNLLAEFTSVVDAVQCAVAVQNEFQTRNAELAENRRMEFRIGINLGDVIDEEDRIYGDGVNIAARLEALADPGGICVSKTAFEQIETKLPLGYEYLGEQSVKNIPKPVRAYRVLMEPDAVGKVIGEKRFLGRFSRRTAMAAIIILAMVAGGLIGWNIYLHQTKKVEPASLDKMAYPLPDRPSIAVLPFDNLSGDPKQEYFCDGLTEEIITALSKVPKVFVIARNSSFTYKGKPVKVQKVSEELGVRYVLEGSVRKVGNRVRITAQLIDAIKGYHLWAERYDRDLKDIFALQDEITIKILTSLQVYLTDTEKAAFFAKGTDNLEAYLKWLHAYEYFLRLNKDDNVFARQKAEEAIAIDPNYAAAYTTLAWTHAVDARFRWSKSPKQSMVRAVELARKAIALDDTYPAIHRLWGYIYLMKRQYDEAIAAQEKAVALSPNWAGAYAHLGMGLVYACRPEEGIRTLQKAIRLNPTMPPTYVYFKLGRAYRMTEQYNEAISEFKKALQRSPNSLGAWVGLTSTYSLLGRNEEAREAAAEVLKINPKFSSERFIMSLPFKNQSENERIINALRNAGLK